MVMLFSNCIIPKYVAPVYQDTNYNVSKTQVVYILPVVDVRIDKKKEFGKANYLRTWLNKQFEIRGYRTEYVKDLPTVSSNLSLQQLTNYTEDLNSILGDSKYKYVFLPVLAEQDFKAYGVGANSSFTIHGFIFDKVEKKVIWRNIASGENTSFGLVSILNSSLSIDEAIGELMSGLPKAK